MLLQTRGLSKNNASSPSLCSGHRYACNVARLPNIQNSLSYALTIVSSRAQTKVPNQIVDLTFDHLDPISNVPRGTKSWALSPRTLKLQLKRSTTIANYKKYFHIIYEYVLYIALKYLILVCICISTLFFLIARLSLSHSIK